jgi:hypothetical protein
MGLGLLHGQPNNYLTKDWYATGDRLATWIEREIPSFAGNVPMNYTMAVVAAIRKQNVPLGISRDAFSILEKREIRFDWPVSVMEFRSSIIEAKRSIAPPLPNKIGAHPVQLKEVSKSELARVRISGIEAYEHRYQVAVHSDDPSGATSILVTILQMVWEMAQGQNEARQMKRTEAMVEWEEFNTAVDQALARAPMLRTHIRYLSRDEIKSFRSAPNPGAVRNLSIQFADRITTRTIPPARRGRK